MNLAVDFDWYGMGADINRAVLCGVGFECSTGLEAFLSVHFFRAISAKAHLIGADSRAIWKDGEGGAIIPNAEFE